ncbi:MAG: DUF3427 domain-containing protein [Actinobacteria bacterium]|nr:DUF3427 domain-containing protein [Actinomycetota bacterium]
MRDELSPGLREALITAALQAQLEDLPESLIAERSDLSEAEAPDRVARHLSRVIRAAVSAAEEGKQAAEGIRLAREVLRIVSEVIPGLDVASVTPTKDAQVLRALLRRQPDGTPRAIERPLTPLLDTTVFTNAPGEPSVGHELKAEIDSAASIDLVMAFIRWSGVRPLLESLTRHCADGKSLRVLTSTYTNSTEQRAIDALVDAGADVRVSYDLSSTRLHAKAWLFHRQEEYSTAYVGSSNLTYSAQVSGLEWNVRLSGVLNPDALAKIDAVFKAYWASRDFIDYDPDEFARLTDVPETRDVIRLTLADIELRPFQERLLELVEVAREEGHTRNLLVAATGTGKTVMAAVDYARLRQRLSRDRLLFVAHRSEILDQSLNTFRHALRDSSFGELWVGAHRPRRFDHVFASIQALTASGVAGIQPEHFDVVIVDEFHHAAAPTYRALLECIQPKQLLGLTATPERSDGLDVVSYFDGRIAAELRVWDAIDQQYLAPFAYYGIHDGLDLREVPWRRGRGYDTDALTNVLTADHAWVRRVLEQIRGKVGDPGAMRALGFCVSVAHAEFMANEFNKAGVTSVAVSASTPSGERAQVLRDLEQGELRVVFAVDLFNEGVDVPNVDTLLLLRPTDSATLFLQQLGRGLRLHPGKAYCTVLDFIGMHRKEFRLDRRFRALLGLSRAELERATKEAFPFLPAGCHLQLDPVAKDAVLRSIRESLPSTWRDRQAELRALGDVSLAQYLEETGLELEDLYAGNHSWTELRRTAGLPTKPPGNDEVALLRAVGRMLHVDDHARLDAYYGLLTSEVPAAKNLSVIDQRWLRMLTASITSHSASHPNDAAVAQLWRHPQVVAELRDLFELLKQRVDHLHPPLRIDGVPLRVHARYTRNEILAAFGSGVGAKPATWQTGVQWDEASQTDLFAFTLDKSTGGFSPTTRYRDYAISSDLLHWESQGATSLESNTGQRYINHRQRRTNVVLFARLRADDRAFWCLGPASYVSHEGDRPIAFQWRLEHRLPGDLYAAFAAAVA